MMAGHCKNGSLCNSVLPHIYDTLEKTPILHDTVIIFLHAFYASFENITSRETQQKRFRPVKTNESAQKNAVNKHI